MKDVSLRDWTERHPDLTGRDCRVVDVVGDGRETLGRYDGDERRVLRLGNGLQ